MRDSPRTTVTIEAARTIITRNQSPDIGFDRSINPDRGCDQTHNGCASTDCGGQPLSLMTG